jgi:DNA processing protein
METGREEQLYWLALQLIPGLGPRRTSLLLERFQTPRALFRASLSELEAAGVSSATAQSIVSGVTFDDAVTQQQKMLATETTLLTLADPRYPKQLRSIFDPPAVLFLRGKVELLDTLMVAVVGTRRPSAYGMAASEKLSRELAVEGFTIVSGMARGIDTSAHKAALEVGGHTAAVLGCGIDLVYPAENRKLADEIAAKGLLISEFPMSTPAYPQNFPIRNRIVAGLSVGVLVVEGAKYSGSGITARLAVEQGRELYAVPGNITNKLSWGPNLLIKQGAILVQDMQDILASLSPDNRLRLQQSRPGAAAQPQLDFGPAADTDPLSPTARALLVSIPPDVPVSIDALIERSAQFSSSEVIAALFELEMMGVIRQLPGKQYVKVW